MSPRTQGRELMTVMDTMAREDDGEIDDTDEGINANKIVQSMAKKETKNNYVKRREIDSLGVKFEPHKRVKGVKGISFQDKNNYSMIDVRQRDSMSRSGATDVW